MSYLESQKSAFRSNLSSASTKLSVKRTTAASSISIPTAAKPQPAPPKNDLKRKQPPENPVVYSQPADTGTGRNIGTQITYAVEYLKSKSGTPLPFQDVISYLSLQWRDDDYKNTIAKILKDHERINYESASQTFSFRPIHNIYSADQLQGYLQSQPTAAGLSVRDIRDGWPEAEEAINQLESENKILATRNKKDDHAKMVWPDDPSLRTEIDEEFKAMWHKIRVPEPGAVVEHLEREGLTPTGKSGVKKKAVKVQEKKIKKPRRSGKTTNLHMQGVLRDYSHLKK